MITPTFTYAYDLGICSLCGVQVHITQQKLHEDLHMKLDHLSTAIDILNSKIPLPGPMGPAGFDGEEGPAGKDAVGSEMFMTCQECRATIHVTNESAHDAWHDMIDDLFEDNQVPMIEEDPSGPPPVAPKYVVTTGGGGSGGSGMTYTLPGATGTYTISGGHTFTSTGTSSTDYSPKDGIGL